VVLTVATCLAAVPALAFALTAHALTTDGVPVADRTGDGLILGGIMIASCAALLVAAWRLEGLRTRLPVGAAGPRRVGRTLGLGAAVVLIVAMVGLGISDRGLGGTVSAQVNRFTQVREQRLTDPKRLLSTNAGNRWVWWKEAAGAFSDKPVIGWGAGSFPVLHLEYRHDQLSVLQPHSVPLQFLAETGIVGAVLALGGVLVLVVVGLRRVVSLPVDGVARGLAAAVAAAAIAWVVHGLVDWDWDIPGVTLPAMAFLGVLAGRYGPPLRPVRGLRSIPLRALGVVAATLVLACVALSAAFPALSDSRATDALAGIPDRPTAADLRQAADAAASASSLNPLSAEGPLAQSAIEVRRGNLVAAGNRMLEAARRDPGSVEVWRQLVGLELARQDAGAAKRALDRALALDPLDPGLLALANGIVAGLTPPNGSATATGTPLPR
jgi:O-Antigen ligase